MTAAHLNRTNAVLHATPFMRSKLLKTLNGQILMSHMPAAGLTVLGLMHGGTAPDKDAAV